MFHFLSAIAKTLDQTSLGTRPLCPTSSGQHRPWQHQSCLRPCVHRGGWKQCLGGNVFWPDHKYRQGIYSRSLTGNAGAGGPASRGAVPCEAKGVEIDQVEELLGSKVSFCLSDKTSSGTCYRYKKYFKNDKLIYGLLNTRTILIHTENRSVVACGMGAGKVGESVNKDQPSVMSW